MPVNCNGSAKSVFPPDTTVDSKNKIIFWSNLVELSRIDSNRLRNFKHGRERQRQSAFRNFLPARIEPSRLSKNPLTAGTLRSRHSQPHFSPESHNVKNKVLKS